MRPYLDDPSPLRLPARQAGIEGAAVLIPAVNPSNAHGLPGGPGLRATAMAALRQDTSASAQLNAPL